jgi:hypothetical protein
MPHNMDGGEGLDVVLSAETATSLDSLASRTGLDSTALCVMVLRLYAADSRIGDDHRIGSGAFADAVDESLLQAGGPCGVEGVHVLLPVEASDVALESLRALAVSEFNRWTRRDTVAELNLIRLSCLLDACLRTLRLSDRYTTAVIQSLKSEESLIEVKEVWWGKWLVIRRAKHTPEFLRDYFGRTHYAEIFHSAEQALVDTWVNRIRALDEAMAAGLSAGGDDPILAQEREFRLKALGHRLNQPSDQVGAGH